MSIMDLPDFNKQNLMYKLKKLKNRPNNLLMIIEFVFSPIIQSLIDELNSKFDSNVGRPAYPREMLLGVLLYCFHLKMENLIEVEKECSKNRFLRIFTCNAEPKSSTFKRFLEESDRIVIKKIFIATLVKLNDLRFLNFTKLFLDGTGALVNGSKHYKITLDEINALKQLKKWNILHNNTKNSINRTKLILEEKLEIYAHDEEKLKLINLALKRIELYNIRMYKKRKEFEEILLQRDTKYVCITFPSAVMMQTKKGIYNYALNLQEWMTENHIIINGTLIEQPNDHYSIKYLLNDLKETFDILIEMQEKFGERRNYREIQKRIDEMIIIADSGYFTDENMYALEQEKIRYIIMPKSISQQVNNDFRKINGLPVKYGKNPETSKKKFRRVKNGYICPFDRFIELKSVNTINFRKKDVSHLPERMIEKKYKFKSVSCRGCPYIDTCKHKSIEERISPLQYEMIEKFTDKRYNKLYKQRFPISEGINGFIKSTNGIFKLISPNKKAADNELMLRNTLYNLIRTVNLKGTAY